MTGPIDAGSVKVEILADASKFAKSLRKEVESAFKGLDFNKLIRDSIGNKPIKIPVTPDFNTDGLGEKVKQTRVPKVPVEVDPLFDAFRQQLRRQTAALAKDVHASIPVDADTAGLREELGGKLSSIAKQLRLPVPAEPADKAAFQAKLQEQLDEVKARVKVRVPVEPDTNTIPEKIKETRVPKVKVEVDPLLAAFKAQVQSEVRTLARTANAKIPVSADTAGLRAKIGADLQGLERALKAHIPTEPGDRAEYEAKLKAQLEEVSHRVKQSVRIDPDTKGGSLLSGIGDITKSIPGLGLLSSGLSSIGQGISGLIGSSAQLGGSLSGALQEGTGPIGLIVSGLLAAAGAAALFGAGIIGAVTFAIPAITALAGSIAAIPALLTGIGAGAGTLLLGFHGISEAFKPKAAGAGGGAGQQAAQQGRQIAAASRQVESARRGIVSANRAYEASERSLAAAERGVVAAQRSLVDAEQGVADAQKRAQSAQVAVNKARQEAADDIADLNLQLKGSKLSEQEATLAVTDALRELNAVKLTGNIPDIQKADLAYQRAQLTLQEATQSTKELSAQTTDANKKGVEGSDKVQSALHEQQDAVEGVRKAQEGVLDAQNGIIDAADSLKSAQDGVLSAQDGIKSATDSLRSAQESLAQAQEKTAAGAAAAAAKVIKLAPAAQAFVNAVKGLKPAFEDLRLDVQQRLFEGLDRTVTHLGEAWIPALKVTLGSYADTFNGFFRSLGASISTPQFITDIQAGAEGARQGLEKIGTSISTNLVPAFGTLSRAAGPFLSQLGGEIAHIVDKFSQWVQAGDRSGKLQDFFQRASEAMHEIFQIGGTVLSIIGSIFTIITQSSPSSAKTSPLESFRNGLQKIADYLGNPANQKKIEDFIGKVEDAVNKALTLANQVSGIYDHVKSMLGGKDGGGADSSLWVDIGSGIITGIVAGLELQAGLMWAALKYGFEQDIKRTKEFFGIHSPSTLFAEIGGDLIDGLIKGIGDGFAGLGGRIGELYGVVTRPLSGAGSWLFTHGENVVIGLENGIGAFLGNLSTRAGQMKTTVSNRLSDAGSWLVNHGRNAVIGLENGINSMYGSLSIHAGNARVYVQNALSDAGNWLYTHGRAVISGLMNGISSMFSNLGNFLNQIGSFIQQHKGPIEADRLLLVGAGQAIMGGLIGGIAGQKDMLASELADVTSIVAGTQLPELGSGLDAVLTTSLQASSQQQLLLGWKSGTRGDQLLQALANLIDVQYQGDVERALTKSR